MAVMSVSSSSPDFSFVVKKNPQRKMWVNTVKQGLLYTWFKGDNNLNFYFRDSPLISSYPADPNSPVEYLDKNRYVSPLAFIDMVNEHLNHVAKKVSPNDVEGHEHTIHVPSYYLSSVKYLDIFSRSFPDIKVSSENVRGKVVSVSLTTSKSLYYLVNIFRLFCFYSILYNNEAVYINGDMIQKYIDCLNKVDSPYILRYLLQKNLFNNEDQFVKYKKLLETSERYSSLNLSFGSNYIQRQKAIIRIFQPDMSVLDIGCGEGNYIKSIAPIMGEGFTYYAVDTDEEELEKSRKLVDKMGLNNVQLFSNLDEYLASNKDKPVQVFLTEVIEHIPLSELPKFMRKILDLNFVRLVITTPNRDFNDFYFDSGLRHEDHKFEFTGSEFENFIKSFTWGNVKISTLQIGDSVDGVATTQGVVIERLS